VRRAVALVLGFVAVVACGWDVTRPTSIRSAGDSATTVLIGAGDIAACGSQGTEATAKLLDGLQGTIFTAGDNAYPSGTTGDFLNCYDPTWGRHKARTRPSPGNHDYDAPGAIPYFDYFGERAGPAGLGYYAYREGNWEILSLNSNIPMDANSAQGQWLRNELADSGARCSLAYWHHPLFSSGPHGDNPATRPLWQALYAAGAEIVVVGHDHLYERFAPQDADGKLDPVRGIREFVVGTGGGEMMTSGTVHANSDARLSAFGVLQLTLGPDSYSWAFLTGTGAAGDTGAGVCH
jgi:hypothetical protein